MKLHIKSAILLAGIISIAGISGCESKVTEPSSSCYVRLYDGDNFTDEQIVVNGPGSFSDLKNLPGANENWSGDADALKTGPKSTVTVWPEEGFKGTSATFDAGAEIPKLQIDIKSMKIVCVP